MTPQSAPLWWPARTAHPAETLFLDCSAVLRAAQGPANTSTQHSAALNSVYLLVGLLSNNYLNLITNVKFDEIHICNFLIFLFFSQTFNCYNKPYNNRSEKVAITKKQIQF